MPQFPQVGDPAGGPGLVNIRNASVQARWQELCERRPEAMAECFRALLHQPYPDMWADEVHGPVRGAATTIGPAPTWGWRLSDIETVRYIRGPDDAPLVTKIGAPA